MTDFDWSFIDRARCISLKENEEIRKVFTQQCKTINLPFEFHIVDRHPEGGLVGCFESHMMIIKDALENNVNNLLIFEDDARFFEKRMKSQFIDRLKNSMKACQWDLVYFGHMPYPMSRILTNDTPLAKSDRSWMSHSYILSKAMMQTLWDKREKVQHYDAFLHKYSIEATRFVVYPMLYFQDDRPGSVSATWVLSKLMSLSKVAETAELFSVHYICTFLLVVLSVSLVVISILVGIYACCRRKK
jgi:GR25 family glycosyltransferase involved in LPS biosynthesis